MSATRSKTFASPAAEARTWLLFLVYTYTLLSMLAAVFIGLLLYGLITRRFVEAFAGAFLCFSLFLFRRPARILLKDFHRRRNRALLRRNSL